MQPLIMAKCNLNWLKIYDANKEHVFFVGELMFFER